MKCHRDLFKKEKIKTMNNKMTKQTKQTRWMQRRITITMPQVKGKERILKAAR